MKKKRENQMKKFQNRYKDPQAAFLVDDSDEFWYNTTTKRPPIILTRGKQFERHYRITEPLILENVDEAFAEDHPDERKHPTIQNVVKVFNRLHLTKSTERKKKIEVFESEKNVYTYAYYGRPSRPTTTEKVTRQFINKRKKRAAPRVTFYYHRVEKASKQQINETLESEDAYFSKSIGDSQIEALEAFVNKYSLKTMRGVSPVIRVYRNLSTPDPSKYMNHYHFWANVCLIFLKYI